MPVDLQAKCAKQAREAFESGDWNNKPDAVFANHYNMAMDKCFVIIRESVANPISWEGEILFDAFEGVTYGHYMWSNPERKHYWEVKPFICTVDLPSGDGKQCQSRDEFEELIKVYMGPNFH